MDTAGLSAIIPKIGHAHPPWGGRVNGSLFPYSRKLQCFSQTCPNPEDFIMACLGENGLSQMYGLSRQHWITDATFYNGPPWTPAWRNDVLLVMNMSADSCPLLGNMSFPKELSQSPCPLCHQPANIRARDRLDRCSGFLLQEFIHPLLEIAWVYLHLRPGPVPIFFQRLHEILLLGRCQV